MGGSILDFLHILKRNASFVIFELSEKAGQRAGRFRTLAYFQEKREFLDIRTFRKRGRAGGLILRGNASFQKKREFLDIRTLRERGGGWVDFGLPSYFQKPREFLDIRTFRKRWAAGGSTSDTLRVLKRNASFLIFDLVEEEGQWARVDFGLSLYFQGKREVF